MAKKESIDHWMIPQVLSTELQVIGKCKLTAREVDVTACLVGGRDSKKIGQLLNITTNTVRNHRSRVYSKLHCHSRDGLIEMLQHLGTHERLRMHYLHLQLQPSFKNMLLKIRPCLEKNMTLLFIKSKMSRQMALLFSVIAHHLKETGVKIEYLKLTNLGSHARASQISHVISNFEPHTFNDATAASKYQTWWKELQGATGINITEHDQTTLDRVHTLNLQAYQHFYGFMIALMKLVAPNYDPSSFQSQCERMMGQSRAHTAINTHPLQHGSPSPNRPSSRYNHQTHITWNLPRLVAHYIERNTLTETIWKKLEQNNKATATLVGLCGSGGVGKTMLAIEAIHYTQRHYAFRGWFRAGTVDSLQKDYVDLGSKMDLFSHTETDDQKIMKVKEWLESQSSCLLVYDDTPDMGVLKDFLPHRGHILITSRNNHIPRAIDVDVMSENESIEFLLHLIPDKMQQEDNFSTHVKKLSLNLGYFPLALAQAGHYMGVHQISLASYLKHYQHMNDHLLSKESLPPGDEHAPAYITWQMSLEAIKQHIQGAQALQLLDGIAYLHHEEIPKTLLAQYLFDDMEQITLLKINDIIEILTSHSLIKVVHDAVSIHGLIQHYLRHRHDIKQKKTILRKIGRTIDAIRLTQYDQSSLANSLICHGVNLRNHGHEHLSLLENMHVELNLAWMHLASGNHHQAKHLLAFILPAIENYHGKSHKKTASLFYDLGHVTLELGQFIEARHWYHRALQIHEHHPYGSNLDKARVYHRLGDVYLELGQLSNAKSWYQKSLPIYRQDDSQIVSFAEIYNGLGAIARGLGQLDHAKIWYDKALSIYKKQADTHRIGLARTYRHIGSYHREIGALDQAKKWYEAALAIIQSHDDQNHIAQARIYHRLGWLYQQMDKWDEARSWLDKACFIYEHHYGKHHKRTAHIYHGQGLIYLHCKQLEQAKMCCGKVPIIYEQHYGEHSIWMAYIYHSLGLIHLSEQKWHEGQLLLEKSLYIHQKNNHRHHLRAANVCLDLGLSYLNRGDHGKAKKLLIQKAMPMLEKDGNRHHTLMGRLHQCFAQIYGCVGCGDITA